MTHEPTQLPSLPGLPQNPESTRKLISAINTPIAYLTLSLLLTFGAIGILISRGQLTSQGTDNLGYAMIGGAGLVLLCFFAVLRRDPDRLFGNVSKTKAIQAFAQLDQQLTPPDITILQRMLGRAPNFFFVFCQRHHQGYPR